METNHWLKLVEYGDYPHADGVQHVTRDAAFEMQKKFRSLRSRFARKFSGVPIYIGHPDDRRFAHLPGHNDTRSYAWIQDIEAREDGIWILPKWSSAGKEIIKNAFFKFLSPRWEMKCHDGQLIPIRLISVGLTNNPNIPGEAIANQASPAETQKLPAEDNSETWAKYIEEYLGVDLLSPDWQEKIQQLAEKLQQCDSIEELKTTNSELQSESDRFYKLACEQEQKIKDLTAQLMDARILSGENFVNFALKKGTILPNEADTWKEKYIVDPEKTTRELLSQSKLLNTTSKTENLNRNVVANQRSCLLELVRKRMSESGEDYAMAWNFTKQTHPELFKNFL